MTQTENISTGMQVQRYNLLCRCLQASPLPDDPLAIVQTHLETLEKLIFHELLALARQASPDDFADLYLDFARELERFREFSAYPVLAKKHIVAFGGAFSAGKSSLINALIGQPLMVAEVDPTTALPAYVVAGNEDQIFALNPHKIRIPLTDDEFTSLTHDEREQYGSEVSRALTAAFVIRKQFPWNNLAFIDTPGYSGQSQIGGRTDASIAAAQLNTAHAIVWVVNSKQGVLPESDLSFLSLVDRNIPKLIVLSRADQINEQDLFNIIGQVKGTLTQRNIPFLGVYPASAHPRHKALLTPITEQLVRWNEIHQKETFSRRFKTLFIRYQRGLESQNRETLWYKNYLNKLQLFADDNTTSLIDQLLQKNNDQEKHLAKIKEELTTLQHRFFTELKKIGALVGIELPEPHELDLITIRKINLIEILREIRETNGISLNDFNLSKEKVKKPDNFIPYQLLKKPEESHLSSLIRLKEKPTMQTYLHLFRAPDEFC